MVFTYPDREERGFDPEAKEAKAPLIPWLPPEHIIPRVLHKPNGEMRGYCEPMVASDAVEKWCSSSG